MENAASLSPCQATFPHSTDMLEPYSTWNGKRDSCLLQTFRVRETPGNVMVFTIASKSVVDSMHMGYAERLNFPKILRAGPRETRTYAVLAHD